MASRKGRADVTTAWSDRYDSLIQFYAGACGLDWRLIKKQIEAESSFLPGARSPKGAMGLMQFMPETWKEWGEGDPFNPEESIRAGCRYMAHLYGCYGEIPDDKERYKFALAAYNAGRGNVNKALAFARLDCGAPESFYAWDSAGRPPGPWQTWDYTKKHLAKVTGRHAQETIAYVDKITKEWDA